MSPVRQATLINYHLAIEDSVDIDKIWENMQTVFDEHEQQDIETEPAKKEQMKKMLDILPSKNDAAFDQLVKALRPDYKWLALRLQQGVKDEEVRIGKLGKGIKRKIALALLTARISERQKDGIMDRVAHVVEMEMSQKAMRVNIPDHRAAAQLDRVHRTIQELIRDEVDPILYGEEHNSTWDTDDYDETLEVLKRKLEELQVFKECYQAVNIGQSSSSNLPSLLLQKIEEIKTKIKILQQEKQEAASESARLAHERDEQQRSISKLEQYNRSLELENRTLEDDKQFLEQTVRKLQNSRKLTEKDFQKLEDENRDLKSELQQQQDRLSDITLRIRSLDDQNMKLTRDNQKLSAANAQFRKNAKTNGHASAAALKSENKRLTNERAQLKKDIQKMEVDKRQLVIRSQKLEAENANLKEQKRKLLQEKKRFQDENKTLREDAKRLAIGKYALLPPIDEDADSEDNDNSSRGRSRNSRNKQLGKGSQQLSRKIPRTTENIPSKQRSKTGTPWNKYKDEDRQKGSKAGTSKGNTDDADDQGAGTKKPASYMMPTAASRRRVEDGDISPRRAAAWK
nr:hypothetical protein BaRGS_018240 [Batillaria attramentaria]